MIQDVVLNRQNINRDGKLFDIDWTHTLRELRKRAGKLNILVIPHKRIYHRYITDYHPSERGNENIALDIADFLEGWEPFHQDYDGR